MGFITSKIHSQTIILLRKEVLDFVSVCLGPTDAFAFAFAFFCSFLFIYFFSRILGQILLLWLLFIYCACTVATKFDLSNNFQPISAHHTLFTDPQISLFSNFFIKNWSHGPIHIFKIILLQYFSVFSFSFQFSTVFKRTLSVTCLLKRWDLGCPKLLKWSH